MNEITSHQSDLASKHYHPDRHHGHEYYQNDSGDKTHNLLPFCQGFTLENPRPGVFAVKA